MAKRPRIMLPNTCIARVRIFGLTYSVYAVKGLEEHGHIMGECTSETDGRILVDAELPMSKLCETVLHEVLHAIDGVTDLGLNEHKVRVLSQTLTQAFGPFTAVKLNRRALRALLSR